MINHLGRRHARHAADQHAAAMVGPFEILRADLHRQASGDFAHRLEQRQRMVVFLNRLVGDRGNPRFQQLLGQLGQWRQVQIGVEHQAGAKIRHLAGLRLLDFDDDIGLSPDVLGGVEHHRAGLAVILVGNRAALARARLDQHFVAGFAQRGYTAGHQPHAGFMVLDFTRNPDNHPTPP
jgi:hypothetical protein